MSMGGEQVGIPRSVVRITHIAPRKNPRLVRVCTHTSPPIIGGPAIVRKDDLFDRGGATTLTHSDLFIYLLYFSWLVGPAPKQTHPLGR